MTGYSKSELEAIWRLDPVKEPSNSWVEKSQGKEIQPLLGC